MPQDNVEESTLWKGVSSHIVNFGVYLLNIVLMAVVAASFFLVKSRLESVPRWVYIAFAAAFLIPLLVIMVKVVILKSVVYEITSQRIKIRSGIFSIRIEEIELFRIKDSTFEQPFFYRLFGRGNIVLNTSDRTLSRIFIRAVPRADRLREEIRRNVEIRRQLRGVRELDIDGESDLGAGEMEG